MIDAAALDLAQLIASTASPESADLALARVTQVSPLFVRVELGRAAGTTIGPLSSTGASLAITDQVALLWIPDSHAFICIGKVT